MSVYECEKKSGKRRKNVSNAEKWGDEVENYYVEYEKI